MLRYTDLHFGISADTWLGNGYFHVLRLKWYSQVFLHKIWYMDGLTIMCCPSVTACLTRFWLCKNWE